MESEVLQWVIGLMGEWGMLVMSGLGMLVVVGECVVVLTPSKADDAAWAKIKAVPFVGQMLSALAAFAPIQKK